MHFLKKIASHHDNMMGSLPFESRRMRFCCKNDTLINFQQKVIACRQLKVCCRKRKNFISFLFADGKIYKLIRSIWSLCCWTVAVIIRLGIRSCPGKRLVRIFWWRWNVVVRWQNVRWQLGRGWITIVVEWLRCDVDVVRWHWLCNINVLRW